MPAPSCPVLTLRFRAVSQGMGLVVAVMAGSGLWIWPQVAVPLREYLVAYSPLTLFALMGGGLSLWLMQARGHAARVAARALGLIPLGFGIAFLALMRLPVAPPLAAPLPGFQTAVSLLLIGLALVLLDVRTRPGRHPSEWLALLGLLLPYLALIGYAFNLGRETAILPFRGMSLLAAFGLVLLAVGTLGARPDRGLMGRFSSPSLGGSVLRRLAPAAFWAPLLLGWLRLIGERAGVFAPETGTALITLLMGVAGIALVLWNVETLDRTEAERRAFEEALKASETRYRHLVELSPEAIMVDLGGRLIFVNPAGAQLIGARDAGQLMGRSLTEFVHPDDVQAFNDEMARARVEGRPTVMFEKKMVRLDGSTVDVETTASPITFEGQEAMLAIIRDITERKKAMEQIALREAEIKKASELDRLKDHFLSTLSHEMKTPLSLVIGYSELLEDKYPGEDLVAGIQDGARRLKEHIDSMLDYSALLSGTLPLYKLEVYMPEVVEGAVHITQAARHAHAHPIRIAIDPATPPVTADPRRLTQILVELLDNACKFTPAGGAIGIRVRPVDGMVQVEVWDTGPGIAPDELPHIWEPFGQLAIGNTGRRGGLGLGLTIARKLTELHGGSLAVQSTPGQGSCFAVRLPIAPPS